MGGLEEEKRESGDSLVETVPVPEKSGTLMSFWDHLDVLRSSLVRIVVVSLGFGIVAFCFKKVLFSIVLAPGRDSFATYRLFDWINGLGDLHPMPSSFNVELINTGLAEQFMIHVKTAFAFGFFCAAPYVLYLIFKFVSPALYANERRYAVKAVSAGYLMFLAGVLLSYFLIFPLTFRFLGTYQVSSDVANMITLQSYMGTLMMMSILMGIVFELPVLCWLLGKLGILSAGFMRRFRKHSIIVILIISAIITPTSDVFTLTLVALPIWLLYEISILLVGKSEKNVRL